LVKESVKRIIGGWSEEYEGNDLDYDTIKMEAEDVIYNMANSGERLDWRNIAQHMGFRLETLNGDDLELLKDAIEEAMMEDY
jgi:hypothetical protein